MFSDHHRQESVQSSVSNFSIAMASQPSPPVPPVQNGHAYPQPPSSPLGEQAKERLIDEILHSDVGVQSLLTRLKQSIMACREFSSFAKRRSSLEEEHTQGLRKLCSLTYISIRHPECRQGTYSRSFDEAARIHERIADNGTNFSLALQQMHEDLTELGNNMDRGRKHWKQTGLNFEKRVHDVEMLVEKAKIRYDTAAEEYDRVKSGDRRGKSPFSIRGTKRGPQHEDDLLRKVQVADLDYASKVQQGIGTRAEITNSLRPQAVKSLREMISECDSGLTAQLQRFAQLNEKYMLSNGLSISPMKAETPDARGMRDVISLINNEKDFENYVLELSTKVPPSALNQEVKYERHPSLDPAQKPAQKLSQQPAQQPPLSPTSPNPNLTAASQSMDQSQPMQPNQIIHQPNQNMHQQNQNMHQQSQNMHQQNQNMHQQNQNMHHHNQNMHRQNQSMHRQNQNMHHQNQPIPQQNQNMHQQAHQPVHHNPGPDRDQKPRLPQSQGFGAVVQAPAMFPPPGADQKTPVPIQYAGSQFTGIDYPRTRPVFGQSLEALYARDETVVPVLVYQCIQAVDLYGLDVEGIYRLSGEKKHVEILKQIFDNDPSSVDFRRQEDFFFDVNSVASILKQFFRDLPDPLLTNFLYKEFINASRIDDDVLRRDSLHELINRLPDPNYATLRAVTLHLNRVQENCNVNRMNSGNLAICFGPTLMGSNLSPNIADAGWQVRVVDTVLEHCFSIFDDD